MKRLAVLLLAALLLLGSCAPAVSTAPLTQGEPSTKEEGNSSTKEEVGELYLFRDGQTKCEVVASVKAEWQTSKVAADLREALSKKVKGARVSMVTDVNYDKSLTSLLVGETRDPLSKELYDKLEWYQVGVLIRDGKVAIGAGMEENLTLACNWFRRNYVKVVNESMAIPASLEYLEDMDLAVPEAPEFMENKEIVVTGCGDDCYLKRYTNTNAEEFLAYCTKLEQAGFTKAMENKLDENLFASYTNGRTDVHFNYVESTGVTRVVLCPAGEMVPREVAQVGETKADVYMLSTVNFGLSMVIHLQDGRFILIDGAQQSESRNLVEFLKSLTPEGEKPVIAAWIFTHAHPDHTYALYGMKEYGLFSSLKVERFIYNFPSDKIYEYYEPACSEQTENVRDTMKNYFPDALHIKPHTGNQMILGGVTVDFLCTQEDVLPNSINDFNDTSLLMRFTIGDQRLLVTGDMSQGEFAFCNTAYSAETLKADVFQTPHHGWNLNTDFFNSVSPKIVLLSANTESDCQNVIKQSGFKKMLDVGTQWVGSFQSWKLTMPFEGDTPCELTWKDAQK